MTEPERTGPSPDAAPRGVPDGASAITPRLFCRDPAAEIDFCREVFGAIELGRRLGPDGVLAHALLRLGGSMLMIDAEWPAMPTRAPAPDGSSPVVIYVYVEDVDTAVARAVVRGATVLYPVQDQFWGDRIGWIMDPEGHVWTVATRVEETTAEQREARWDRIRGSSA